MILGKDAKGKNVRQGDTLLDKRGGAWRVLKTEGTLRKQLVIRVRSVPLSKRPTETALVRLSLVFRVTAPSATPQANIRRWKHLYDKYTRPAKRAAIRQKRRVEALPLKPCPACLEELQPCKFKLGVRVWRGRKLRVCSKACVYLVRRRVRRAQRKNPTLDTGRIRLHIARMLMQKGGQ